MCPPSGFNFKTTNCFVDGLDNLYKHLMSEVNLGKHQSIKQGIDFEIKQITNLLTNNVNLTNIERGILLVVLGFYQKLQTLNLEDSLEISFRELKSIHIQEDTGEFIRK